MLLSANTKVRPTRERAARFLRDNADRLYGVTVWAGNLPFPVDAVAAARALERDDPVATDAPDRVYMYVSRDGDGTAQVQLGGNSHFVNFDGTSDVWEEYAIPVGRGL